MFRSTSTTALLMSRFALVFALLTGASLAQAAAADPQVVIDAIPTVVSAEPQSIPITVSGFGATEVVAVVGLPEGSGSLTLVDGDQAGALTLLYGYGGFVNREAIGFSGEAADVAAALASKLVWNAPMGVESVELTVSVSEFAAGTHFNPANGHYYMPVAAAGTSWTAADAAAKASELFGMTGYLATLTSQQENDFVSNYTNLGDIWIGASDAEHVSTACGVPHAEGAWRWAAGPEACTHIWQGAANGAPVNGQFARWASGEPNNSDGIEHYAATNFGGVKGRWNDFPDTGSAAGNYLVEFGGLPTDANSALRASDTETLSASPAIVIGNLDSDGNLVAGDVVANAATEATVAVGLQRFDHADASELVAVVSTPTGGGTLSIDTSGLALTLEHGYDGFADQQTIGFHGSLADVSEALRTRLTWAAPAAAQGLALSVSVGEYTEAFYYNPVNGHYYKPVVAAGTWSQARADAAAAAPLFGMTGYLATITSQQENDFVSGYVAASDVWIGASDDGGIVGSVFGNPGEGAWHWVTGPEAGTQFCAGNNPCNAVDGEYASWASGEPNNSSGEHFAVTNWSSTLGRWNDLNGSSAPAYLVEFGDMPGEVSTIRQASAMGALEAVSVPSAPLDAQATAGNAEVTLSWSAPSADGRVAITDYRVTATPSGADAVTLERFVGSDTTTFVFAGLHNGTEYTFAVAAVNAVGVGPFSTVTPAMIATPVSNTTLAAPSPLPDGASLDTAVNGDGTSTTSYASADGNITQVTTYGDDASAGSVTLEGSNGRTSAVTFDGGVTATTINDDGSVTLSNTSNGVTTTATINADGSITYSQGGLDATVAAGSTVHVDAEGNLTVTREADGLTTSDLTVQACYVNDFSSGTLTGWTALASSGFEPQVVQVGGGPLSHRLRLTTATNNQATGITKDVPIPAGGIVEVEFFAHAHGGNGADGLAVILSDWDVDPVVGAKGGSLGYAQSGSTPGFAGGWVGIGIDEYGNFANANEGRAGGPGFRRNAVSIRGSGSGTTGYRYIDGTLANLAPKLDNNYPGHRYLVKLDTASHPGQALVTVQRSRGRMGSTQMVTLIDGVDVLAATGQAALPEQLRLSITSSTGGLNNIHEISELAVSASACEAVDPPVIDTTGGAGFDTTSSSTSVGTVAATSDDATLSYFIAGGDDAALFEIDPATGVLEFKEAVAPGNYTIEIAAEDSRGNVSTPASYSVDVVAPSVAALATITAYADDASGPAPVLSQFADLGVTGVTADNLAAVNAALAAAAAIAVDTAAEVQSLVDAVLATQAVTQAIAMLPAVGDITLADAADVAAARAAYDALSGVQQARIDNLDALEAAETRLADLQAAAALERIADQAGNPGASPATEADFATSGITGVTLDNIQAINDAIAAAAPADVAKLEDVQALVNDVVAALTVDGLIAALPTPGDLMLADLAAVEAARAAFDALTPAQQARIDEAALLAAEAKMAQLIAGPHRISTPEQLAAMADHPDWDYVLADDIDLGNFDWHPIGSAEAPFTGSLVSEDGSAVTIEGLAGEPLFGVIGPGAVIGDLIIVGSVNADAGDYAGLLANRIAGTATDPVRIDNVTVDDASAIGGGSHVGGVAGIIEHAELSNIRVGADVSGSGNHVGGIAGSTQGGSIVDSSVTGEVTGTGNNVGPVVGNQNDTVLDNVTGGDLPELDIELLDADGNPLPSGPIAAGQEVRIAISGASQPIVVSGTVTRGDDTEALGLGTDAGVVLTDPDGGAAVLIERDGVYYFSAARGGRYELRFQDRAARVFEIEFEVRPQVAFSSTRQPGTAGETLVLHAVLEGTPAQYPVRVPYQVSGFSLLGAADLAAAGEFVFEAGGAHERILTLALTPNASAGQVVVTLSQGDGPEYALLGNPFRHVVVLRPKADAPLHAAIRIEQDGSSGTLIRRDAGPVTLTAVQPTTGVPFDVDTHDVRWAGSALELGIGDASSVAVAVDPQLIGAGLLPYRVALEVTERAAPSRTATAERRLRVVEQADAAGALADDAFRAEGPAHRLAICPQGESMFRQEGDRTCSQVDRSATAVYLEVPEGYRLELGRMSEQASWDTGDFGLEVTLEEFIDDTGMPLVDARDEAFRHLGYRVDFELHELDFPGQSIPAVIPLPPGEAIPADAVWRKYFASGWRNFMEDDGNEMHSARRDAAGNCPWPGSDRWADGLAAGDECVRLIIQDGGPNDLDGRADGVIRDPGTLAVADAATPAPAPEPVPEPSRTEGRSGGGGAFGPTWLLALGLLLAASLARRFGRLRAARAGFGALACCGLLLAMAPVPSHADVDGWTDLLEGRWYIGGLVGSVRGDIDAADVDAGLADAGVAATATVHNRTRTGWRLFGGLEITPHFALEAGVVELNDARTVFEHVEPLVLDLVQPAMPVSGRGIELAPVVRLSPLPRVDFYARAGAWYWQADYRLRGNVAGDRYDTETGVSAVYGLAGEYRLAAGWHLRLEADRYRLDGEDLDLMGLSVVFRPQ